MSNWKISKQKAHEIDAYGSTHNNESMLRN